MSNVKTLDQARDVRYPIPVDNPHTSVRNRNYDERAAYKFGWVDCLANGPTPEKNTIVAELKVVLDHEITSVVGFLLDVAQAANLAMQDCEDCGDHYKVQREDFDALSVAMEKLEALPDDRPGYTLSGPGKAEWALRDRGEATDGEIYEAYSKRADPAAHQAALDESLALLPQPVAEQGVDDIVTALYRRFKDWSRRGFGPDDVTWCEVKADVVALITACQQVKEIDHGDIFDLIREWAHLPEGQRHDAARAIIGRMNQSYAAGVADGKVLGAASQQAAEPVAKFYARAVDMNHKGSRSVIVSPRIDSEWNTPLYAAPAIQQPQDERAAFQAEMQRHGYNMIKEAADPTDYAFPAMRAAWRAWQARATLGNACNCKKGAAHG